MMKPLGNMRTRGFTLIEFLMVAIIVGLLTSIAVASYLHLVDQARSTEALQHLDAVRSGELAYRADHGTFVAAMDAPAINNTLDVTLTPRYFDLQIAADADSFLATATSKSALGEPFTISMDETGRVYYSSLSMQPGGGATPPSGGGSYAGGGNIGGGGGGSIGGGGGGGFSGGGSSGGSSGGGGFSGGGGGIIGGGGSTGGGGGSGSSGGSDGGGGTGGTGGGPDGGGAFPPGGTFTYIDRGPDQWFGWPDVASPGPNITGTVGVDSLAQAWDFVANSNAHFVTDDLARKAIEISFGPAEDFLPNPNGSVAIAFLGYYPSQTPPAEPYLLPFIEFNPDYANEDPATLAAVLVHEGTHFRQYLDGSLLDDNLTVVDIEFVAWWNAAVYWQGVQTPALSETRLGGIQDVGLSWALQGESYLRDQLAVLYED